MLSPAQFATKMGYQNKKRQRKNMFSIKVWKNTLIDSMDKASKDKI